jgi:hypothetical protein
MATDQLTSSAPLDIQALRQLLADVGHTADHPINLHAGHLANPDLKCNCPYIFDDGHIGGIGEVYIDNGLNIIDGGNDAPKLELAIAYLKLLVGAVNALPALLDKAEGK